MLSSSRSHAAGRCIHCAEHSRLLSLEHRRFQSSSYRSPTLARGERRLNPGKGTRHVDLGGNKRFRDDERASRPRMPQGEQSLGSVGKDGFIRKFFGGNPEEKRPPRPQSGKFRFNNADFPDTLRSRLEVMKDELEKAPVIKRLQQDRIDAKREPQSFDRIWKAFIKNALNVTTEKRLPFFGDQLDRDGVSVDEREKNMDDLERALKRRGQRGLDDRIKYTFYGHITGERFTKSDINNQKTLADLRYPSEWFPAARAFQRTIHLHVGPTNSGKTYNALQRLEQAQSGVYAGPLRLLAHEVYTRMKAKGKHCALVTGEERRVPEGYSDSEESWMTSCTVEMMPMNVTLDVAVIDEIQMIGDEQRGWAWTQALLGVKAREVHLCGEERTVPLIREIAASLGEKVEVHKYKRLSPLKMADEPLNGNLNELRKGDCIVSFSVMGIHALRKQIERATGKKVATVYGSLPPETRASQARLFNDPDNDYDFLVASDAVGMGLNLAIKRMIFEASNKFDGIARRTLSVADIKQIAGRAGRYRTAAQAITKDTPANEALAAAKGDSTSPVAAPAPETETLGLVTTLEKFDFPVIKAAMSTEPEPIRTAGIFPPGPVLERFSSYFPPGTPFSYILTRLHELSMTHKRFHLCALKDQVWVADLIEPIQNLSVSDRNTICSCPASQTDVDLWRTLMPALARIIADQSGGSLVDIAEMPLEALEAPASASREYLRTLEQLHKGLTAYLWLSYRFAGIFSTRALAFHAKEMVEQKIEEVLGQFSFTEAARRKMAAQREKAVLRDLEDVAATGAQGEGEADVEEGEVNDADASSVHDPAFDADEGSGNEQSVLDRFGGEEDVEFEEPGMLDAEVGEQPSEDKGLGSSSSSAAAHTDAPSIQDEIFSDAIAAGEEMGRQAAASKSHGEVVETGPTVADVEPELAAADEQSPTETQKTSQGNSAFIDPSKSGVEEEEGERLTTKASG